jgi:hypothetical protein
MVSMFMPMSRRDERRYGRWGILDLRSRAATLHRARIDQLLFLLQLAGKDVSCAEHGEPNGQAAAFAGQSDFISAAEAAIGFM